MKYSNLWKCARNYIFHVCFSGVPYYIYRSKRTLSFPRASLARSGHITSSSLPRISSRLQTRVHLFSTFCSIHSGSCGGEGLVIWYSSSYSHLWFIPCEYRAIKITFEGFMLYISIVTFRLNSIQDFFHENNSARRRGERFHDFIVRRF